MATVRNHSDFARDTPLLAAGAIATVLQIGLPSRRTTGRRVATISPIQPALLPTGHAALDFPW
jgi:hypothetical protein